MYAGNEANNKISKTEPQSILSREVMNCSRLLKLNELETAEII